MMLFEIVINYKKGFNVSWDNNVSKFVMGSYDIVVNDGVKSNAVGQVFK